MDEKLFERTKGVTAKPFVFLKNPITEDEITHLVSELNDQPQFKGSWSLAENGIPLAILQVPHSKRVSVNNIMPQVLSLWNWPTSFGNTFGLAIGVAGKNIDTFYARMFIPDTSPFVKALAMTGKIYFALLTDGKLSKFYFADFLNKGDHPETYMALQSLLNFEEEYLFHDEELAYWNLVHNENTHWFKEKTTKDSFRLSWYYRYYNQIDTIKRAFEYNLADRDCNPYKSSEASDHYRTYAPFFDETLNFFLSTSTSLHDVYKFACESVNDPKKLGDMFAGMIDSAESKRVDWPLWQYVKELILLGLLNPENTDCGLNLSWLDGKVGNGNIAVKIMELNWQFITNNNQDFWKEFQLINFQLFDLGLFLTPKDLPIPTISTAKHLSNLKLDCTEDEAIEAINMLLIEAREGCQWNIPWGARVQLNIGPLKYLDLYDTGYEIYGVFRDSSDRFLLSCLNVLSSKFTSPYIWRENLFTEGAKPSEDEDVQNKEASLSLMLIFASIIRDFIVVEERQSLFSTKPSKENRCRINRELSVIYLPRVIYTENPNVRNYVERFGKDIPRSAHDVSGHIRKVEKASPVQIILAQKYGFHIPQGYTFVRPHRRGTEAEKAIKKIYRSRTASSVIYRVLDTAPKGTRPMWFEFEKDVARFMKALGLTVIHVSSSGKGDGGIDVYAHNEVTDEIFAIQCKCYAPGYKVGPDVIRELSGTLNKYPEGIKGMILTTSSFTKGALEEAVTLGIEVINGQDFVNMAKGQI